MKTQEKNFNPNEPALDGSGIFGLNDTEEKAEIIVLQVPWAVTVSSGTGTENGPERIIEASKQVDLGNVHFGDVWEKGIVATQDDVSSHLNVNARDQVEKYLEGYLKGEQNMELLESINEACKNMVESVYKKSSELIFLDKKVVLVGGDHSTPLGYILALLRKHKGFGVFHIDAHMDLRNAFGGFNYSHASIMRNVMGNKGIEKLVSVGIRSYCAEEIKYAKSDSRVQIFFDRDIQVLKREKSWYEIVKEISDSLPEKVYISIDIDGLKQQYCPNTGTPVPGGLEYQEVLDLLDYIGKEKEIIGMDLVEVGNGEWDGTAGAELLYQMIGYAWGDKS